MQELQDTIEGYILAYREAKDKDIQIEFFKNSSDEGSLAGRFVDFLRGSTDITSIQKHLMVSESDDVIKQIIAQFGADEEWHVVYQTSRVSGHDAISPTVISAELNSFKDVYDAINGLIVKGNLKVAANKKGNAGPLFFVGLVEKDEQTGSTYISDYATNDAAVVSVFRGVYERSSAKDDVVYSNMEWSTANELLMYSFFEESVHTAIGNQNNAVDVNLIGISRKQAHEVARYCSTEEARDDAFVLSDVFLKGFYQAIEKNFLFRAYPALGRNSGFLFFAHNSIPKQVNAILGEPILSISCNEEANDFDLLERIPQEFPEGDVQLQLSRALFDYLFKAESTENKLVDLRGLAGRRIISKSGSRCTVTLGVNGKEYICYRSIVLGTPLASAKLPGKRGEGTAPRHLVLTASSGSFFVCVLEESSCESQDWTIPSAKVFNSSLSGDNKGMAIDHYLSVLEIELKHNSLSYKASDVIPLVVDVFSELSSKPIEAEEILSTIF